MGSAMTEWASNDPGAAFAWLTDPANADLLAQKGTEVDPGAALQRAYLGGLAAKDPDAALEKWAELSEKDKENLSWNFSQTLSDAGRFDEAFEITVKTGSHVSLSALGRGLAKDKGVAGAAAWLKEKNLEPERLKEAAEGILFSHEVTEGENPLTVRLDLAAEHFPTVPAKDIAGQLANSLTYQNPGAIEAFVESTPPGEIRDAVLVPYASQQLQSLAPLAERRRFADLIEDDDLRNALLRVHLPSTESPSGE